MARQRRHNRTRRSRGRLRGLYQLLAVVAAVAAISIGCIVFFRVQTISVTGNARYTAEEITGVSGIESGDYLVLLDRGEIAHNLRSGLPYIESVGVRRVLPDSVLITVAESKAAAALPIGESWWLINRSGKLLESLSAPDSHAVLMGFSPLSPVAGEMTLLPEEQSIRWDYAMDFLKIAEEQELSDGLLELDCSTAGTFTARYDGDFTLIFPSTGDFSEYLAMFKLAITEELGENETGVFDFTHYDTTGYVYFRPEN